MGFFDFLKGGDKKKSGEIEVVEEEVSKKKKKDKHRDEAPSEEHKAVSREIPAAQKVEEKPVEKPAEKPAKQTVFGMPAPQGVVQEPAEKRDAGTVSGELGAVSGSIGGDEPADEAPAVVSGELGATEAGVPDDMDRGETEEMQSIPEGTADAEGNPVLNILRGPDLSNDDLFGGGSGEMPVIAAKESKKTSLSSHINCEGCSRRLPIPFQGYPAKITCPFCLRVNEYKV